MKRINIVALCLGLLGLAACSSYYPAPVAEISDTPLFLDSGRVHRVNSGETLYAIAWMYDLDFAALARANSLREPYVIVPGQILTVDLRGQPGSTTTATTPAAVATASPPQPPAGQATVNPVAVTTPVARSPLPATTITRQSLPDSPAPDTAARVADSNPRQGSPVVTNEHPATETPVAEPASVPQAPAAEQAPATDEVPQVVATLPEPVVPPETTVPATTVTPPPEPATAPATAVTPPPEPAAQPDTATTAAIQWAWPSNGELVGRFNASSNAENKGVDFAGDRGDPVLAAADGEVVYAGSGLLRYGDLVILKHDERFLSAYAHNSRILVAEGQRITRGEKIAELGSSGIDRNMLHFEIRLDGKPVDPLSYLPSR